MTDESIISFLSIMKFNQDGLIAAIAQQHNTNEVLMMAWMNQESIIETLTTNHVCYYSRSRQKLWRKGETSGQVQTLIEMRLDCDGDTILLLVDQKGVACHTGRRNCFFHAYRHGEIVEVSKPLMDPNQLYHQHS